jgi:hypothetical protein
MQGFPVNGGVTAEQCSIVLEIKDGCQRPGWWSAIIQPENQYSIDIHRFLQPAAGAGWIALTR